MNIPELARALDDLNAMGALESLTRRDKFTWGPKAITRHEPPNLSAVIWRRGSSYHGYKTLTLIGVWAFAAPMSDEGDDTIQIVIGVKRLAYNAPFFDAEAYHKLIRRDFAIYYNDDGAPPPLENQRMTFTFEREQRLEQRKQVIAALRACLQGG